MHTERNMRGCRIFARDALGGDPGCPQPLPIPINQLGKKGRIVDFTEYFKKSGGITAREYMERYGVVEKKAIKELNLFTGLKNKSPKFKYTVQERDIIFEVQDSIGYTSGGAPFASAE